MDYQPKAPARACRLRSGLVKLDAVFTAPPPTVANGRPSICRVPVLLEDTLVLPIYAADRKRAGPRCASPSGLLDRQTLWQSDDGVVTRERHDETALAARAQVPRCRARLEQSAPAANSRARNGLR